MKFTSFHRCCAFLLLFAGVLAAESPTPIAPMPPVLFHGKPFFPVGCYDMVCKDSPKGFLVDPGFVEAGGNIALLGALGLPGHPFYKDFRQPVLFQDLERMAAHPEYSHIAFLIGLDWPLVFLEQKQQQGPTLYRPLTRQEEKERSAFLAADLRKLRQYPNVLGYYLDEPENALYRYYEKNFHDVWQAKKDQGLAELLLDASRWINQLIRREHPEAKLVPGLGWWTTYQYCAEMYDIQNPAQYPASADNLAEVCYDAVLAVNAARRAGGGRTVIYSPAMFDQLEKGWKYAVMTREQERYVAFAPITRGCMGVIGWRLKRCTPRMRREVVYPTMREVSELSRFFLGEWHDHLVTSDRDKSTAPHLQTFKERIRMVDNEEESTDVKAVSVVPDVCHCLRKDPLNGEYLLLIVSNLREKTTVKFHYAGKELPPVLTDYFTRTQVETDGHSFQVELEPFGVRGFRFFEKGKQP